MTQWLNQAQLVTQIKSRTSRYLITQVHAIRRNEVDPTQLLPHLIRHELLQNFAQQQVDKIKNLKFE